MVVYLASDHAGFHLKEELKTYLESLRYAVEDYGNIRYEPEDDYPDFVRPLAEKISEDHEQNRGIIIGGSGEGEAIVANRIAGVRAAVWYGKNEKIIQLSREHNDANILSIGARFVEPEEAKRAVKLWLETPFSREFRHERRIDKIDKN